MAHQFYFNPYILDNLPAPSSGFDVVQDVSEPRLRMYITSRGIKSFFVRKRVHGKDKRIIIGNYPEIDIETARSAVQDVLDKALQKVPVNRHKISFKKIVDIYMLKHVRRTGGAKEKLYRAINLHLFSLFDKTLVDITTEDVKSVIDKISGPVIAGRMQELLRSIFNYAIETGYAKNNPVDNLPKRKHEIKKSPLNKSLFNRLLRLIKKQESQNIRSAFLMLIYGFAPKSKIFSMQWKDLDFNHYTWNDFPLSDAAVVLLQDLPQNGRWVFPGRGRGHLTDPRIAWRKIVDAIGVSNLTIDDLYKYLMRQLTWTANKEDLRFNMNDLLNNLID